MLQPIPFVSLVCVKKLKLPIRELDVELVVSTPIKFVILTCSIYVEC